MNNHVQSPNLRGAAVRRRSQSNADAIPRGVNGHAQGHQTPGTLFRRSSVMNVFSNR